jgi:2-oxoglutarate ferredoxin oxidoreductase subunit beta
MEPVTSPLPAAAGAPSRQEFLSTCEPRWCPGCGDYSVLKSLTGAYAELGVPRENVVVVSGIGCSSRFPYYTSTYGFHTIHGRAPTVALGVKLAKPELDVWVITGDGDALSIGGNHFVHLMRRNPDVKVVLFNNEIYGLTKGQASPTSRSGLRTKTSPYGTVDRPVKPLALAIAAGATFAARVADTDGAMMKATFLAAARHKGVAVIEVLTNCVIFNDGAFEAVTSRKTRAENTVELRHGQPLVYGAQMDKGLRLRDLALESVTLGAAGGQRDDVHVFDAQRPDSALAYLLAQVEHPALPLPMGVFRAVSEPTYESLVRGQEAEQVAKKGKGDIGTLFKAGELWRIDANGATVKV